MAALLAQSARRFGFVLLCCLADVLSLPCSIAVALVGVCQRRGFASLLLIPLVLVMPLGAAPATESTFEPAYSAGVTEETIQGAASDANGLAGTSVDVTGKVGGGSKIRVKFVDHYLPDEKGNEDKRKLAETRVLDNATPDDPSDDFTYIILISKKALQDLIPDIFEDPDLLRRILAFILAHEFDHVTTGEGGSGHAGGADCAHLQDFVDDCSALCSEVLSAINDPNMKDEDKCRLGGALCLLHERIREFANSDGSLEAAEDCDGLTVTNNQLVGPCAHCPLEDCPVHGTDFGSR